MSMNKMIGLKKILLVSLLFILLPCRNVLAQKNVDIDDGEYEVEVKVEGGTGKAKVTSPAYMKVESGKAYVRIEWSSPNYDYMIVGGNKLIAENTSGNSVFTVPVEAFDTPLEFIADTVAMSKPHEITYKFTFVSDSISNRADETKSYKNVILAFLVIVVIVFSVTMLILRKGKTRNRE